MSADRIYARRSADLAACVTALRRVHLVDAYPRVWPTDPAAWLCPPRTLGAWVTSEGGAVLGHVVLTDAGRDLDAVHRLFVAPEPRGRGLAVALLETAIVHGQEIGRTVELDVLEESTAAVRLYERLGWILVARGPAPFTWPDGTRPVERRYRAPQPSWWEN